MSGSAPEAAVHRDAATRPQLDHKPTWRLHRERAAATLSAYRLRPAQQTRRLGDVRGDAPRPAQPLRKPAGALFGRGAPVSPSSALLSAGAAMRPRRSTAPFTPSGAAFVVIDAKLGAPHAAPDILPQAKARSVRRSDFHWTPPKIPRRVDTPPWVNNSPYKAAGLAAEPPGLAPLARHSDLR
jgi:hypothetical protein